MLGFFSEKKGNSIDFVIVGLGNPGDKYAKTRHNAGFLAVDYIAEQERAKISRRKFKSFCADVIIEGKRILLLKPQTFMNLSGQAVVEAMQFYKLQPSNVILIFDDISLEVGKMRIRAKGSDGGHNGIKNIIYLSGSDAYPRVKIGIGAKPANWSLANWVTSGFTPQDEQTLQEVNTKVYTAVKLILAGQMDKAMNLLN